MPKFKQMPMHPNQILLFNTTLDESVAEDCDVRIINELMDMLDWSKMEVGYSDEGCPAYPPSVMTKILAYALNNGVRSSRKIEALLEHDIRYIWLAGGLKPDFHTLARFRREKKNELVEMFEETVKLCDKLGLVFLNNVAIDGTKVRAKASKRAVYNQKRIDRQNKYLERVLEEIDEQDKAEDEQYGNSNGREVPEHLKNAERRREKLKQAQEMLDASDREKVVLTESESRVMKTHEGKYPGYNVQAAVDCESHVVLAMDVVQNESDHGECVPMAKKVKKTLGRSAKNHTSDTGFCDEKTILDAEKEGFKVLMPPQEPNNDNKEPLFCNECFLHDEEEDVLICPVGRKLEFKRQEEKRSGTYRIYAAKGCQDCSFYKQCAGGKTSRKVTRSIIYKQRQEMRERLKTEEGWALYQQRSQSVEPVFGSAKSNRGLNRFSLSGKDGATAETALAFLIHNIRKCAMLPRERLQALKTI